MEIFKGFTAIVLLVCGMGLPLLVFGFVLAGTSQYPKVTEELETMYSQLIGIVLTLLVVVSIINLIVNKGNFMGVLF